MGKTVGEPPKARDYRNGSFPAKVVPPKPGDIILRERLFSVIDRARVLPILWISGPAGCGKTTLVSSYLHARRLRCLWYRADEGDHDLSTFFYYMGMAARLAVPGKRKPLPLLTPERVPGYPVFAQRYFEELFERLAAPFFLVIDDIHHVREGSPLDEVIRKGMSALPPGLNAVLVSRSDPRQAYSRHRANRLLASIGWRDLKLTPKETGGILRRRRGMRPDEATILRLQTLTDGWAAGLVLLLEREREKNLDPGVERIHSPDEMIAYFAGEVLETLPRKIRSFLLASAFLPGMTARMASRVTGEDRADEILTMLCRHNYFTERRPGASLPYCYHSLFREFLLSRAVRTLPREELYRIRRVAADALEENGHIEEAVALRVAIADWTGLVRLILASAPSLVAHGRHGVLADWIGRLPPEVREVNPWIVYWTGTSGLPFDPRGSRRHFERASAMFEAHRDAAGIFLSLSGAMEAILFGLEGVRDIDAHLRRVDDLAREFGGFPSVEVECRTVGAVLKLFPHVAWPKEKAEPWAQRGLAIVRRNADVQITCELLVSLAIFRMYHGDLRNAETLFVMLGAPLRSPKVPPLLRLIAAWGEACHANLVADRERCLRRVSEGIRDAEAAGIRCFDLLLWSQGALAAMNSGDFPQADRYLHDMEASLSSALPFELSLYHFLAASRFLHKGDPGGAGHHAEESFHLAEAAGWHSPIFMCLLQLMLVLHLRGDGPGAEAHLDRARGLIGSLGAFGRFSLALVEAYIFLERGEKALASLKEAGRIGREEGYAGVFLSCPGFLEKIAAKALEEGIEADWARELIRRNRLVPGEDDYWIENWPWAVKVYTLGRFGVVRDGGPGRRSRKVPKKPMLMLKALIALGGREVSEEKLSDILWPEAEGDLAHQVFHTTLKRLRDLLGDERALRFLEGRLTLDARVCWVDAWVFERMLGGGGRNVAQEDDTAKPDGRLTRLEKALALYNGSFLGAEHSRDWMVSSRERLRGKYLRGVEELGSFLERAGKWEKAIALYRRGLDVDDLSEAFYGRLMVCHRRLGSASDVAEVYRRCRETLAAELGVKPSRGMEKLYRDCLADSAATHVHP